MPEATDAVSEPRYWKITVNPDECPTGAWELFRTSARAMLGLPGKEGDTNYAVRNMQRMAVGDWLVAYTPQEGAYTVGGIGRVVSGYQCEEGPFDHAWNGTVRRSVGVEWHAGACNIADLVKEGRFRKGKIPRVLDKITAEEFGCVRDRVLATVPPVEEPPAAAAPALSDAWAATDRMLAALVFDGLELENPLPAVELEPRSEEPRPSPVVLDPAQEQPPLPQFFLDWSREEKLLGPDLPAGTTLDCLPDREEPAGLQTERSLDPELAQILAEAGAAILRPRDAHLLAGFGMNESEDGVLDFGLPASGVESLEDDNFAVGKPLTLSEVRVGATGWTGLFRREVESGRPCSLLLRGPQYSFLNMTPAGTPLRGLPLFALFAIGAVSAPGKEAFRGGARFIFRGRRESGDYEVEVRPRRVRPVFREPVEAAH